MLDVHRGLMSWRRLRVLIQHLPPESATMTALRNAIDPDELEQMAKQGEPERGRWSQLEQLLALSIDVQRQHMHAFLLANHGKGKKPDRPEPIRRPGARQRKKKLAPMTEGATEQLFALING